MSVAALVRRRAGRATLAALALALAPQSGAIIFFATEDPAHNTTEPTGALAGSGWQYQGQWLGFLGTAIASDLFITARHFGGAVGDRFSFRGVTYPTVEAFPDAQSDLVIYKVCGSFPEFAPLYAASDEVNQRVVLFGRGASRGQPVILTNGAQQVLKGWAWGPADGRQRWGVNRVATIIPSGSGLGDVLKVAFDSNGEAEEASLSGGDSGGAMFIQSGTRWQLAGINLAVDGPYNFADTGPGFPAALFDQGGLYVGGEGNWQRVADTVANRPSGSYATRISTRLAWINEVIAAHAGVEPLPVLEGASSPEGPYLTVSGAQVDASTKTITWPVPTANQFFRLRFCQVLRISSLGVRENLMELRYE